MAQAERRESADLIVVGASVGGLMAAILAADRGCPVVVLEKGKEMGGGATTGAGVIAASGTRWQRDAGVDDTPDALLADLRAVTNHHVEADVARAVVDEGAGIVEWLADRCSATVTLTRQPTGVHSRHRLHACGAQGGTSLVAALMRVASRHNRIRLRPGSDVQGLVRDDTGAVVGVELRADKRGTPVVSGRVLLACGGYAGDDALVAEHCPGAAELPHPSPALADGTGLRLGLGAGGGTRELDAIEVTPFLAQPANLPVPATLVALGAILVNQSGQRFVGEDGDPLPLALAVRAQRGRVAYLVFDDRIAKQASVDPYFEHVVMPRGARSGSTLKVLARQLDLELDPLAMTVENYNANIELGGDPFGRARCGHPLEPTFHAIRVTGARLRTLGGLVTDVDARVLDGNGAPIPGLYATGGTTACFFARDATGAIDGIDLLTTLATARRAARSVIAAVRARDDQG
jgi:fumarate reductase flavoprotein subunit